MFTMRVLICYLILALIGLSIQESQDLDQQSVRVRRQTVSYSSSVIHDNPGNPEQHAQSTVKVQFSPSQTQHRPSYHSYKSPRAVQQTPTIQTVQGPKFAYQPQSDIITQHSYQPQDQLFNVGYSVSFTSASKPARSTRQRLENAEIITGQRTDVVEGPNGSEFKRSTNAANKIKHFKYAEQKSSDPKQFINNNLSPKTQLHYAYLGGKTKSVSSRARASTTPRTTPTPSWSNLSPSVEIYRSRDLPNTSKVPIPVQFEQSRTFDHAGALGRSVGFDYTNALGNQQNSKNTHSPQSLDGQYSQKQRYVTQTQTTPVIQYGKTQNQQNSATQFNVQKFPIDTTLLKNPVLTVNPKLAPKDDNTLPIPFDLTLLKAMQQQLLNKQQQIQQPQPSQYQRQVQEYQQLQPQQSQLFKAYGKPQVHPGQKDFDQYFDQYFDKLQSQESRAEASVRHPKTVSRAKSNNFDLQTDLRPPPLKIRRRRMYNVYV